MNIQIIPITNPDGTTTDTVLIDNGNNTFTSMDKSAYDAQQDTLASELSNPSTPQAGE